MIRQQQHAGWYNNDAVTTICFDCRFPLNHVAAVSYVCVVHGSHAICCRCCAVRAGQQDAEDEIRRITNSGDNPLHSLAVEFLEEWLSLPTRARGQYPLEIRWS